ncbi:MAG: glycosyltransferase family 39 protein [Victivallaceae bacterium]|nr:glycosyltransferase family 39 protein [Victivallaceae bacterium]
MLKYLLKKKFFLVLLAITLAALAVRLGAAYELQSANGGRNAVNFPPAATDMCTYRRLAELISQGDFHDRFYYQPFYYAVFLPLIYLTLGYSPWAVIVVQSLLGAATVYLVGLSTARIWNRQAAVLAALMAAFSQVLIVYTPYLLIATLQAFWLALLFYVTVAAFKSGRIITWAACALVTSCAILSRGNIWLVAPGIIALAVYSLVIKKWRSPILWHRILQSSAVAAVFLLVIILPQFPFAWHNTVLNRELSGPSTAAPAVLSLGNTPEAPPGGREAYWGAGPMEYPPAYGAWMAESSKISIPQHIWQWFRAEPLAVIELNYRKFLLFWDYRELPNNISLESALKQSSILNYGGLCLTAFLIVPALAGLYVLIWRSLKKRDLKLLLLMYFILAYAFATAMFYILARFRAPVIPLLAILGGIFVNRVWRVCKNDRRQLYIPYIIAFCTSTFICFAAYETYRENYEAAVIREVRPNGVRVQMGKDKMMYLDNGPQTFGGWTQVLFNPGSALKKEFKICGIPKNAAVELELMLLFAEAGEATLRINGELKQFTTARPGAVKQTFPVSLPADGTVRISLISASCPVGYLVDTQRNYGRSQENNRPIKGEIVCRLFISPPPQKTSKKPGGGIPTAQTATIFYSA